MPTPTSIRPVARSRRGETPEMRLERAEYASGASMAGRRNGTTIVAA
jgi:hypothetical protein